MKTLVPLLVATALIGCGRAPPANSAAAVPDNVVGDAPGENFDIPASAAAADRVRSAAMPAPTDGMAWSWDAARQTARFGPSPTVTAFAIACSGGRLILRRFDPAPGGSKGTMSFTGNGRVSSLPATSIEDAADGSAYWQAAETPSDRTAAVARTFEGAGPVEIALPGTTHVVTRPSPVPGRAFAACRG